MRPCQVINFIIRTSKKYTLFVCLVMYLKVRRLWPERCIIAYNITCHLIMIILLHVLLLFF